MQKMAKLTNWSDSAISYFKGNNLWNDNDGKTNFADFVKTKAKEYGDEPVTYEQGTKVAREADNAQQKAIAAQPKTPLEMVTGLSNQLKDQELLAKQGVPAVPADTDFTGIPKEKQDNYLERAKLAKDWNDGKIPAFALEGNIYVQPELTFDPEAYKKAVEETDATPQEKAKTLANYPQIRQKTADQMLGVLEGTDEYKTFKRDNPLANYGDDPTARLQDYLKKSKDLGTIENIRATVGQIGLGAKLGWQQTAQSGYGVARAVAQLVPGEGIAQDAIQDVAADTNAEASKLSQQSELLGGAKPVADITAGVISTVAPLLAGGAAGIAVKGLSGVRALAGATNLLEKAGGAGFAGSVVGSGFQQFGSSYLQAMEDYQKQGKTEDEAAQAAFVPAIATGLSTAIITTLGGKYGVESVFRNEAKEAAKKTVLGITKELGIDFSAEAAEEFTDQLVQGIVEKATTNPDKSQEQIINEAVYAGIIGGVAGGLFGGAHQVAEALHKEPSTPPEIRKEVEQASKDVKVERLGAAATNADENYAPLTGATVAKIAEHVANTPASVASPELTDELDEADEAFRKLEEANTEELTTNSAQNGNSVVIPEEPIVEQANDRSTDNTTNLEVVPQAGEEGIPANSEGSSRVLEQPEPQVNQGAEGSETRPVVNEEAPAQTAIPSEQATTELAPAEVEQPAAEAEKVNEPTISQPVEAERQSIPETIPEPAVGQRVMLGKQLTPFTVEAIVPQTESDKSKGEQYYDLKNEQTGEIQRNVLSTDFRPIKGKQKPKKTTPNEKSVTQVAPKAPIEGGSRTEASNVSNKNLGDERASRTKDLKRRAESAFGKDLANVDFSKLQGIEDAGIQVSFEKDGTESNVGFLGNGDLVLNINPDSFESNESPAKISKVFEEEAIHVAQHLALRKQWEEAGKPGYYSTFIRNKGVELQRDLIERWNQIKDKKQKDVIEKALVGAYNLYYQPFWESRSKIRIVGELINELNDGAESSSKSAPNHISYVIELTRQLHQLKRNGQITESLFKQFINEIGKWFHKAFGDLKQIVKEFGDDGILSKSQVAKFINDYEAIINGGYPSKNFIPKGESSERSKLDKLFAKSESDRPLGATNLVQTFGPITDEQANIIKSEETAKIIKNLAYKFSNVSGMDVNDLQQEGHLKLFNAIQKFDPSRGNSGKFVNQVVGNQFKTIYEQQLRKQYESLNEPLHEGGGEKIDSVSSEPIPEGADVGRFDIIRDAVKKLPGRERTALQMRAEGYDLRTIGDLIGMSHEGVNKVIKRVTAQLRSTLAKEGITSVDDIFPGSRERTQYLPIKYGAETDETRIVEQATEAKLASDDYIQDLRAATKKEDDGIRTFSKREEARRSQVGGVEEVGHLYNPVKMEPAKEAVREKAFNGSQQPSEESTAHAWDYIGRLTDLETGEANEAAGEINRITGTDLGAALLQNELLGYSVRLAATGDSKMLNHLLATVNLMPTSELGTGQSANAQFLRSRAEFESHLITGAKAVIDQADEQTARILAGGTPTLGDLAKIKEIKQELTRMKLTPEDALEGLQKRFEGIEQTIQKTFQREGITIGNDMLEAIRQLAQMGYDDKGEFTFTYNPEAGPNASEKTIKSLVATGVKSYAGTLKESGANALNSTFWKTLASTENKIGPLAEIDQAQTAQLAAIVQQTLKGMGLQGTPPNTKLTDIEKVASILGKQELSKEKVKLADEKIRESIKDNMEKAIESASDEKSKLAAKAYYSSLLTAWDTSMQRQLNMPVSDAMMRRLISTELSEANTTLRDLHKGNKGDEVSAKKAAVDSILRKLGAVSWKEMEYKALESWLNKTFDGMMQTKATEIAAQKLKSDAKKAAAQTPDATAEGIIEGMAKSQSDTQGWSKPQQNAIKKIIKDDLSNTPNMGRKGPWQSQLIASLVNAGVSEETAQRLADVTWREHQIKSANHQIKAEQDAAEKGPLAAIVDAILATPISQQSSPTWVNDAIMQYLRSAGLSTEQATNIAKAMAPVLKKRFEEAQIKAAEKSIKTYAPWADREKIEPVKAKSDLEKILQAVRSRALDPSSSFSDEIAKKNGWTGFSDEQFKRLAELDDIINSETSTLQAKTKAQDEIMDIVRKAKIQPSWKATISEYYTGQALGGIPTAAVNIGSPAIFLVRDVITDGAAAIAANPAQLPNVGRNFVNAMNGWVSEVSFALKNDVYTKETNEFLAGNKNLKAILESGYSDWDKGDYKKAMMKIVFGLADYTRRVLSALDQGSVSVVEQYNLSRYAQSTMKRAGIPQSEINQALSYVIEVKNRYYQNAVAAGMAPNEAGAASNDAARDAWRGALADKNISGTNVERAALLDGLGVVGRKGKDKEEDLGFSSFPAFWIMKKIAGDNKDPAAASIFTRIMYGFFMIPARTVHNGAWYSPYGFVRLGINKILKNSDYNPYARSLATDIQTRARMNDAIAGTIVTLLLGLGASGSGDDDDKKYSLVVTGNGPSQINDKAYYDAWIKKYQPWSIYLKVNGVRFGLNVGRGGEAILWATAFAAALDDWKLKSKKNQGRRAPKDLNGAAEVIGSIFSASMVRGPYSAFTRGIYDYKSPVPPLEQLASKVSFTGKTFIPILGNSLTKNISDFFSTPTDRTSMEGSLLSNIPFAAPIFGKPAINALGDPIRDNTMSAKFWKLGSPIVVDIPENSPKQALYKLILKNGQGPTTPVRSTVEATVGRPISDGEWYNYAKAYGDKLSFQMMKNLKTLEKKDFQGFKNELDIYSKYAKDAGAEVFPESNKAKMK